MRKVIIYLSIGIAVLLLVHIVNILLTDLNRLTNYGYGYLVGKIILLLVFIGVAFLTWRCQIKSKNSKKSI